MSLCCECPWTGKVFDMAEQLSEARGRIAAALALDTPGQVLVGLLGETTEEMIFRYVRAELTGETSA